MGTLTDQLQVSYNGGCILCNLGDLAIDIPGDIVDLLQAVLDQIANRIIIEVLLRPGIDIIAIVSRRHRIDHILQPIAHPDRS